MGNGFIPPYGNRQPYQPFFLTMLAERPDSQIFNWGHNHMGGLTNRQKQAAATKEKIFRCAVGLFAQKSYENVTIQDICTKAKVSVGAFYHHFGSKEHIINEGYRLFDQQSEARWEQGHPADPLGQIQFLIGEQAHSMEDMGARASLQYFKNQLSCTEKYILDPERFFNKAIRQAIEAAVSEGILSGNPEEITEDILGVSRGIIYDWCLHEGSYSLWEREQKALKLHTSYYGSGQQP